MKKVPIVAAARRRNRAPSNSTDFDTGQLLSALMAFKRGDFSARLPENWIGVSGKIADLFNAVIETNERMARELERIGRVVGKEGRITQRVSIGEVTNSWADAIASINDLIGDLYGLPARWRESSEPSQRGICLKQWRPRSKAGR